MLINVFNGEPVDNLKEQLMKELYLSELDSATDSRKIVKLSEERSK
jgi:hypothetical protein